MNYIFERLISKIAELSITYSADYFNLNLSGKLFTKIILFTLSIVLIYFWIKLLRNKDNPKSSAFDFLLLNSPNLLLIKIPYSDLTLDFLISISKFINTYEEDEVFFCFSESVDFSSFFKISKFENQTNLYYYSTKINLETFSKELGNHEIKTHTELALKKKSGNVQVSFDGKFPDDLSLIFSIVIKGMKAKTEFLYVKNSDILIYNYLKDYYTS